MFDWSGVRVIPVTCMTMTLITPIPSVVLGRNGNPKGNHDG